MIKVRKVAGSEKNKQDAAKSAIAEDMGWLYNWRLEAFEEEFLGHLAE